MGGTPAMIEAGQTYLTRHKEEEPQDYNRRLTSTTLYGGYSDTVKKQSGKPFIKDIVLNEDVPPQIELLADNFDGQGRNLTSFAYDCFKQAMVDGISFIYVDYPPVIVNDSGFATDLDQLQQGARPSAILINSSDILGIKTQNILGRQELTEIRISESVLEQDPKDKYLEISIEQVRLLRPGSYELWRKNEKQSAGGEEWYSYEEGTTSVKYIPIVPVYTNRIGFFEGYPPLRPLAELNKEHWQSSSEQRNALTYARFAMAVFTGVDEQTKINKFSPNTIFKLPHGAGATSLTTAGEGISQGTIDILGIEERMRHTGLTIRVQTDGGQTATEANINSEEANASLLAAAKELENSIDQVLQIFADYMGLQAGGTVEVYSGFGRSEPATNMQFLDSLHTKSVISTELLLTEIKQRGGFYSDIDIEKELARLNDESIVLANENGFDDI